MLSDKNILQFVPSNLVVSFINNIWQSQMNLIRHFLCKTAFLKCIYFIALFAFLTTSEKVDALVIPIGCGNESSDFGTSCSLNEMFQGGSIEIDNTLFNNWSITAKEPGGRRLSADEIRLIPYTSHNIVGFLLQDRNDTLKTGNPSTFEYVSEEIQFTVTHTTPTFFGGFTQLILTVSYGNMLGTVSDLGYASASASVYAEVQGDRGSAIALLQCTFWPQEPDPNCVSPVNITAHIDYPIMKEPHLDWMLDSSIWLRAFSWPKGSAEIEQVLFAVKLWEVSEPSSLSLFILALSMLAWINHKGRRLG
jgi:hypothetical protein